MSHDFGGAETPLEGRSPLGDGQPDQPGGPQRAARGETDSDAPARQAPDSSAANAPTGASPSGPGAQAPYQPAMRAERWHQSASPVTPTIHLTAPATQPTIRLQPPARQFVPPTPEPTPPPVSAPEADAPVSPPADAVPPAGAPPARQFVPPTSEPTQPDEWLPTPAPEPVETPRATRAMVSPQVEPPSAPLPVAETTPDDVLSTTFEADSQDAEPSFAAPSADDPALAAAAFPDADAATPAPSTDDTSSEDPADWDGVGGEVAQPSREPSRLWVWVALIIALLVLAAGTTMYLTRDQTSTTPPANAGTSTRVPAIKTSTPSKTPSASPTDPNQRLVSDVAAGQCFLEDQAKASGYQYIWVLDCAVPHDSEIFFNGPVDAATYPSSDEWAALATQYCDPAFATYVGMEFKNSIYDVEYLQPDEAGWNNGTHSLLCYVKSSESTTGSVYQTHL